MCLGSAFASAILAVLLLRIAPGLCSRSSGLVPSRSRLTSNGICCDAEHMRTTYRWSFFSRHAESAKSFALEGKRINAAPFLLLVIPKASLEAQQTDELRRALCEHVLPEAARAAEGTTGFPVAASDSHQADLQDDPTPNPPAGDDPSQSTILMEDGQYEYDDFAVASTGWRPSFDFASNRGALAVLALLAAGVIVSAVSGIIAATHLPLLALSLLVPGAMAWLIIRSMVPSTRNLAGGRGLWTQHVLSYAPATISLSPQGITLQTPHHDLLLKTGSPITLVESPEAFSLVTRHREIILPHRLLTPESIPHIRESLTTQFGPPTPAPPGRILRLSPPADNPTPS